MFNKKIKVYENKTLDYFKEISKCIHVSYHLDELKDYLCEFAVKNNLKYKVDDYSNVIIYKPSKRKESSTVILQAHYDMVASVSSGSNIDLTKSPITIIEDGDLLKAKDSTLGADDGIGVSYMLSLLVDYNLDLPNLECVFTSNEEVGLIGANNLDVSNLHGSYLINLDSEEEGEICVSSAGGNRANLTFNNLERKTSMYKSDDENYFKVEILNLKGGHSGIDIDKNRMNAIKLFAKFLEGIKDDEEFELFDFFNVGVDNLIATNISFYLRVDKCKLDNYVKAFCDNIKEHLSLEDRDFEIKITKCSVDEFYFKEKLSVNSVKRIFEILKNIKQGITKKQNNKIVTSQNMGIIKLNKNSFSLGMSLRSQTRDGLVDIKNNLKNFNDESFDVKFEGEYNPWEENKNSYLRKLAFKTYKKVLRVKPKITIVHAGLECSVFKDKMEDLDLISIGPNIYNAHTINEYTSIKSINKIYYCLINILCKL